MLRFPLPLWPGTEWEWEGEEFSDGQTNRVRVKGKVFGNEFMITKAGKFEALKIETIVESADDAKILLPNGMQKG